MKILVRTSLLMTLLFAFGSVSNAKRRATQPAAAHATAAQDSNVQVIDMTAKKYSFTPSPVHVKKGAKVQLRITATDHTHGFKINIYPDGGDTKGAPGLVFTSPQDCWKLPKGETVTIEFTANTAGHYPFKCCKFCGFGHMGMKGEVVVDE